MTSVQWLLIILGLLIVVPILWIILGSYLRKRDFKRQIEGRRPERRAKENMLPPNEDAGANVKMDMDRMQFEAQMKQNLRGWH